MCMMVSKDKQLEVVRLQYHYELTSTVVDGEEDMRYTSYGISAVNEKQTIVVSFPDVSTNESFVSRLVEQCNICELDALHLEDVLIDYIG